MASLWDLYQELPNGFHDAYLKAIDADFVQLKLRLHMDVWTGDLRSKQDELREAYRPAIVSLSGLQYFVIEPPLVDAGVPASPGSVRIDMGLLEELRAKGHPGLPLQAPDGACEVWIFVGDWNSFMYVASREADLEWLGPAGPLDFSTDIGEPTG